MPSVSKSLDLDIDVDNDALDLAYGLLKEYDNHYNDGQSLEGEHLDDVVGAVHPFMPAYDRKQVDLAVSNLISAQISGDSVSKDAFKSSSSFICSTLHISYGILH